MNLSAFSPGLRRMAVPERPATGRRPWLDHWLESVRDLADLKASHPMMDAVIDEIDGRMIRIGDHWLACSAARRSTRRSSSGSPPSSAPRTRSCCRRSPTSTCP
jgi:hypothetical protein